MASFNMHAMFWIAATKARRAALGPVKASELRHEIALWADWDATYCMGGEL